MESKDKHIRKHKNVGMFKKIGNKLKDNARKKVFKRGIKTTDENYQTEFRKELDKEFKKLQVRALATVLAAGTFIGGFAFTREALPEGRTETPNQITITENTEKEENSFKEGLIFETDEVKKIQNLDSSQEVLNWLKDQYLAQYNHNGYISRDNIKIVCTDQSYLYVTNDGQYVTHGEYPEGTENAIKNDGKTFEKTDGMKVFTVTINGKESDCGGYIKDEDGIKEFKKIILGDKYNEMKDEYTSVLEELGDVTPNAFQLMELYGESRNQFVENKIEEEKAELIENIAELQNKQQNDNMQDNQVQQDGFEVGE